MQQEKGQEKILIPGKSSVSEEEKKVLRGWAERQEQGGRMRGRPREGKEKQAISLTLSSRKMTVIYPTKMKEAAPADDIEEDREKG